MKKPLIILVAALIIVCVFVFTNKTERVFVDDRVETSVNMEEIKEGLKNSFDQRLVKKWVWVSGKDYNGKNLELKNPSAFTVTFDEFGMMYVTTDCNLYLRAMCHSYGDSSGGKLLVGTDWGGWKSCDKGTQEDEFVEILNFTTNYKFSTKGELILNSDTVDNLMILK